MNMHMISTTERSSLPFSDIIYAASAVLDPKFAFMWLENDVLINDHVKEQIRQYTKG
jgi:hypothetical protein